MYLGGFHRPHCAATAAKLGPRAMYLGGFHRPHCAATATEFDARPYSFETVHFDRSSPAGAVRCIKILRCSSKTTGRYRQTQSSWNLLAACFAIMLTRKSAGGKGKLSSGLAQREEIRRPAILFRDRPLRPKFPGGFRRLHTATREMIIVARWSSKRAQRRPAGAFVARKRKRSPCMKITLYENVIITLSYRVNVFSFSRRTHLLASFELAWRTTGS